MAGAALQEDGMGDRARLKGCRAEAVAGDEEVCYALGVCRPSGKSVWRAEGARVCTRRRRAAMGAAADNGVSHRRGWAEQRGRTASSYVEMRLLEMNGRSARRLGV